jgi:sarcosine oxidase subunit gamma
MINPNRKQLVGLKPKDQRTVLEEGAQVCERPGQRPPMQLIGHITSAYAASTVGYPIALAMIAGGRARMGASVYVSTAGGDVEVEVTSPVFHDPQRVRINVSMLEVPWMRVKDAASRLILQCDARARVAAGAAWGVPFAEEPCRAHRMGERATLWLGPEEHLMWQASRDIALPIAELERELSQYPHSRVDVSHRQVALEIFGPRAATILAGACPLDLDLREFPVHMCTRTVLAKVDMVLWRTAPEAFHIEVGTSLLRYSQDLLMEIGREFTAAP